MLNLSDNRVGTKISLSKYKAFRIIGLAPGKKIGRVLLFFFILSIITLFLPWTQNIRAKGYLTGLKPDQRPQAVHSVIAGRIENWFVQEGDYVSRGDTILHISEVKEEYFDSLLVSRTAAQVGAKEEAISSYRMKVEALNRQIEALDKTRVNKLAQAENKLIQVRLKVQTDSIEIEAAQTRLQIALDQYNRAKSLLQEGLQDLNEFERRKNNYQEAQARFVSAENQLLSSRNQVANAEIELFSIENEFQEKLAKTRSDLYNSLTSLYMAEGELNKLQNSLANYTWRSGLYYILAPQSGYVTRAAKTGIGQLIKEGEEILSIMPDSIDLAVEMYVRPIDLPLIHPGNKVRFLFDGWPAVFFSGWPDLSFGTFGGEVVVIDNFATPDGMFRVLVSPDPNDVSWPSALRVGSGAQGIALLNEVPIWYEIWRILSGFPPDYYFPGKNGSSTKE